MKFIQRYNDGWSQETILEMLNDLICFLFISEIKRRVKDIEIKSYISWFLKLLAPVYVYEIANSLESMGISKKVDFFNPGMKDKVQKARQSSVKRVITNSNDTKNVIKEMGIDFNEKTYDLNIILLNDKMIDANYESYADKVTEMDMDFWDSIFDFPNKVLFALFNAFGITINIEDVFTKYSKELDLCAQKIVDRYKCVRYVYSVKTLFSNTSTLEQIDKIFILYRYRMIYSIDIIEEIVPSFLIQSGDISIDLKTFYRKYRALVICILGEEFKNMNTVFSTAIKNSFSSKINSDFWSLNRKLRNNLHYNETIVLSKEEIDLIDKNQRIYFDILKEHINSSVTVVIDKEFKNVTAFFKACQEKGLTKRDIDRWYPLNYIKFIISGKV